MASCFHDLRSPQPCDWAGKVCKQSENLCPQFCQNRLISKNYEKRFSQGIQITKVNILQTSMYSVLMNWLTRLEVSNQVVQCSKQIIPKLSPETVSLQPALD
ncbi:hypothetical protein VNO77_12838 [Canavalia gladiata]|uniref:Uncharacterized protein n=1 Tax=Canavalia gladiata TaxID=3824 RepID=A0AAN9LX81_CANGL